MSFTNKRTRYLAIKGILNFDGEDDRYVFQGVHMLMDGSPMGPWPTSRVIQGSFIGRGVEDMGLKEGFEVVKYRLHVDLRDMIC